MPDILRQQFQTFNRKDFQEMQYSNLVKNWVARLVVPVIGYSSCPAVMKLKTIPAKEMKLKKT